VQPARFREQMELAAKAKLPIIIHCRDAWADCMGMLEQNWRPTGWAGFCIASPAPWKTPSAGWTWDL